MRVGPTLGLTRTGPASLAIMSRRSAEKGTSVVPTRRKFLESAAVVSAAPLAPKVVFADGTERAAHLGVIYDSRFREARIFGLRAEQWGAPVRSIEADITDLWQNELHGRWQSTPVALGGLTERSALFMLEQLAWEYGLRVVYQAEHVSSRDGVAKHRIKRSASLSLEHQLEAAGDGWPAVLADQMLTAPRKVASQDMAPSDAAMAAQWNEPSRLYSWIIAPKTAVADL